MSMNASHGGVKPNLHFVHPCCGRPTLWKSSFKNMVVPWRRQESILDEASFCFDLRQW